MVADQIERRGVRQPDVLRAMSEVPRERFVAEEMSARAFDDGALSILSGQTISQPYMVARMTEALDLPSLPRLGGQRAPLVLDVGTGSGYQAAVLSAAGAVVVSIERDAALAGEARARLQALGYPVEVVLGDGSEGYAPCAPYAGIMVAAAAPEAPGPLTDQLALGGRLVIPLGPRDQQWLTVLERTPSGITSRPLEPCIFVPLVGAHGFPGA